MILIILLALGLALGSFINVVGVRYSAGDAVFSLRKIGGRSKCPHCHHVLRWFELIPVVSFIIQAGRCRKCLRKISLEYPLVEFVSASILIIAYYHLIFFNSTAYLLEILIFLIGFYALLLVGIIDYRYRIIPNSLNVFLFVFGLLLLVLNGFDLVNLGSHFGVGIYAPIFNIDSNVYMNRVMGVLVGAFITGIPVFIGRGRVMGFGDFKLALALGLLFGWPNIVFIIFGAFIIGSIFGLALIARGRKKFKSVMPFAPFLAISSFVVFFYGENLLRFYFQLFKI